MSHHKSVRLLSDASFRNLSDCLGFALNSEGNLMLCGTFAHNDSKVSRIALSLSGAREWEVQWTLESYGLGLQVEIDQLFIEPEGLFYDVDPKPGSLIVNDLGFFVSVKHGRQDVIEALSVHDGSAGRLGAQHKRYTDKWSVYGYKGGVLVLEHHVDVTPKTVA
ncbi:hypothetical protein [Dyella sp. GSA-30]|uniref:hypothetical protein n=1 Tax=Dyella sp. GSA-30 TaxID=2994496 RepID=UPI00248FF1FF|nr:hypothetical protein [Dyella sp. GSA-30]BDU21181.1 hypothetical protein DYGSA30_26380 [Dyella sp. GSA-30]